MSDNSIDLAIKELVRQKENLELRELQAIEQVIELNKVARQLGIDIAKIEKAIENLQAIASQ